VRQDVVRFGGDAGGLLPSRRYCQPSHSHTRAVAANIATSRGLIRSSGRTSSTTALDDRQV